VAFVVLNGGPGAPEREIARALNEQLAQRLPVYMLPRRFRFLDALPMTANGKADRRKLAESLSG
jgi:D-alanine--poly(phosphoribitol) ligase subunit 1